MATSFERIEELKEKIKKASANKIAAENRIKELDEELKKLGIENYSQLDDEIKSLEDKITKGEKLLETSLKDAENELEKYSI